MYTVAEVLRSKGADVATTIPEATVLQAAQAMNTRRIGSLVVIAHALPAGWRSGEGSPRVAGIITERDILTRVVAAQRDPRTTHVGTVMTSPVIACTPRTTLDELRGVMREKRIRHVPVMEDSEGKEGGRLCGLVSIGDLNAAEAENLAQTVYSLEEYIHRG